MTILVTGGAGYIGSHVARDLLDRGYSVLVLDNLSTGHLEAVDARAIFIYGDLADGRILDHIFEKFQIEAVMHFAANALVGESVHNPLKYYQNNVGNTVNLLSKMKEHGVTRFIFSSTCATYGLPQTLPMDEDHPLMPINPYGKSKLMIESILQDLPMGYVSLRYFNVAGAAGDLGEDHEPESHLIPNILRSLQGFQGAVEVYGDDFATPDGTCIRDYIHIFDLSAAHILALEFLLKNGQVAEVFNLGTEKGHSVLEVIRACEEVTGLRATINIGPRRPGDPPCLIASSEKIKQVLGWTPKFSLRESIESAWKWHLAHPNGYSR